MSEMWRQRLSRILCWLANETVAEDYFWQEIPFLYRTHDTPDPEKIQAAVQHLSAISAMHLQRCTRMKFIPRNCRSFLAKIAGYTGRGTDQPSDPAFHEAGEVYDQNVPDISDWQPSITAILLRRSAGIRICRFTGSSRKICVAGLNGRADAHYQDILPEVAEQSSKMERRADEAERETDKMKKAEYMAASYRRSTLTA